MTIDRNYLLIVHYESGKSYAYEFYGKDAAITSYRDCVGVGCCVMAVLFERDEFRCWTQMEVEA